ARGQDGRAEDRGAAQLEEAAPAGSRHPEQSGLLVGGHLRVAGDDLAEGVVPLWHDGLVVAVDRPELSSELVAVEIHVDGVPLVSGWRLDQPKTAGSRPLVGSVPSPRAVDSKAPVGNSSSGPPSRASVSTVACCASMGRI